MRTFRTLFFIALITLPAIALAANDGKFVPLTTLPGIKDFVGATSLPILLGSIYKICIGVAATVAVLQIMRAGVMYMGGDSITEKKEARSLIAMSIVGLILVLSPTIVFSIINPDILKLDISQSLGKLAPGDATGQDTPISPALDQALAGYIEIKSVFLSGNEACTSKLGTDWENIPQTNDIGLTTNECRFIAPGATCCGRLQQTPPEVTPNTSSGISFVLMEESTDFTKVSGNNACTLEVTKTFESKSSCTTSLLQATSLLDSSKTKYVLVQNCEGNRPVVTTATPNWSDLKKLPDCPK